MEVTVNKLLISSKMSAEPAHLHLPWRSSQTTSQIPKTLPNVCELYSSWTLTTASKQSAGQSKTSLLETGAGGVTGSSTAPLTPESSILQVSTQSPHSLWGHQSKLALQNYYWPRPNVTSDSVSVPDVCLPAAFWTRSSHFEPELTACSGEPAPPGPGCTN